MSEPKKMYTLLDENRQPYLSPEKGQLGGNRSTKIYGRMDCRVALRALSGPNRDVYIRNRVFFKDEATALSAGYRPCGVCMKERYLLWKDGKLNI